MIEILYKSPRVIVVKKPPLMPTAPELSGDADLMSTLSNELRERGEANALYLVHRLDRTVGGLVAFARGREAAAELSLAFRERLLSKDYLAVVHGKIEESAELVDHLIKQAGLSRVVSPNTKGAKRAELSYRPLGTREDLGREYSLVAVRLGTGRFHQIRAQLSNVGHALVGDGKYGSHEKRTRTALFAYHLALTLGEEKIDVTAFPDTTKFPWSLFESEIQEKSMI